MGDICKKYNCHKCCLDTEMALSPEDLKRISNHSQTPAYSFSYHIDQFRVLRNVKKGEISRCYFLDDNGSCKIYDCKPLGCTYYPLVYHLDEDEVFLDDFCPHYQEFEKYLEEYENDVRNFVKKLIDNVE